jgi:hypothetical protein
MLETLLWLIDQVEATRHRINGPRATRCCHSIFPKSRQTNHQSARRPAHQRDAEAH